MTNKPIFLLALADIIGVLGLVILITCLWNFAKNNKYTQVQAVNVYNFSPDMEDLKLEAIIKDSTRAGYFGMSAQKLSQQLTDINFVRGAKIVRTWPMSLDVYLEAHKPIAFFREGNNKSLINDFSEVFVSQIDQNYKLPELVIFKTADEELNKNHLQIMAKKLIAWQKKLNPDPEKIDWEISKLILNKSLSIILEINKLWTISLGQSGDEDKTESRFDRFVAALPKISKDFGKNNKLNIDLRYTNFMAVSSEENGNKF